MPNQTVKNGLKAKKIKLLQMKFFLKNSKSFMYILAHFILQKFTELLELIQSYQHRPFLDTKPSICPEQFYLAQTIIITFIYLLALFIGQNLQKTLTADPKL